MAVVVKYVVVRNGKEVMTFTSKKEADAHDKMLEIAEGLYDFLHQAELNIEPNALDELSYFIASKRDEFARLLKGGKLTMQTAQESDAKPEAEEKPKMPEKNTKRAKSKPAVAA